MPNIKPISDLRNYTEVLQDVAAGARIPDEERPRPVCHRGHS